MGSTAGASMGDEAREFGWHTSVAAFLHVTVFFISLFFVVETCNASNLPVISRTLPKEEGRLSLTTGAQLKLTHIGSWPGFERGLAQGVSVLSNLACLALGNAGLAVFDVADPTKPRRLGGLKTGDFASDVVMTDKFAYLANLDSGIVVVDIGDPANPRVVGSYNTSGAALGIAVLGQHAYVADGLDDLKVIDISIPTDPWLAATVNGIGSARGVAVAGNHAFVAAENAGLFIVNIEDPKNPRMVGSVDTSGSALGIAVSGRYAYVADELAGLQVIDIANPADPRRVGGYTAVGVATGVAISGQYAYLAYNSAGLFLVIDVSDPAQPRLVGSYDTPGHAYDIALSEGHAYLADGDGGLQVIDIKQPTEPRAIGSFDASSAALGLSESNGDVYLADEAAGLQIIDVSSPTAPVRVGSYLTPAPAHAVAISDQRAYVGADIAGLQVLDVSIPAEVRRVGLKQAGYAYGLAIVGNRAYVAAWTAGLQILDVSIPEDPQNIGRSDAPKLASRVAVSGNYAYVADWSGQLVILEVSEGANPTLVGTYQTPSPASGVAVSDGYAFVADSYAGLLVLDVRNPSDPRLVGQYPTSGIAFAIALSGNYAFLADGDDGVQIFDASDPLSLTKVASSPTPGRAQDIWVSNNYVYVADGYWGLSILKLDVIPNTPPEITDQPFNQTVLPGEAVRFKVRASGTPPLVYQWHRNGVPLPGQNSADLDIFNVQVGEAGGYAVFIKNAYGQVGSRAANLAVRVTSSASYWSYDSNGHDQGTIWRENIFDDGSWSSGRALFYLGDSPAPWPRATLVDPDASTRYFRSRFTIPEGATPTKLRIAHVVDDGVAIYLNGQEIIRNGLPPGSINYSTTATRNVVEPIEEGPFEISVGNAIVNGENVVAAEVHQWVSHDQDMLFGLTVDVVESAEIAPVIVRQPPAEMTVFEGSTVTLAVDAHGNAPLAYRWRQIGVGDVPEATGSSLIMKNVQASSSGYYLAIVSNSAGSVQSALTLVKVVPIAIKLESVRISTEKFGLRFQAKEARPYALEVSKNLIDWTLLLATNGPVEFVEFSENISISGEGRFFRVSTRP